MNDTAKQMQRELDAMRRSIEEWRDGAWGEWETYKLKWPRRIKGRWYWRGDTVYRRERMRGLTGSDNFYQYGDEFDVLKELNDNV